MSDFVGALDQGTTSTRFMIFDHAGGEVGRHQLEHQQILPAAGGTPRTLDLSGAAIRAIPSLVWASDDTVIANIVALLIIPLVVSIHGE